MNYKGLIDQIYICKNCGIKFKNRGHGNIGNFCSKKCFGKYRTKQAYIKNKERFKNGLIKDSSEDRLIVYKILIIEKGNYCNTCKLSKWRDKEIRLIVNHIDGNADNNWPDNFELLCPNCESQSEFFKNKNYGNGRINRRKALQAF